MILREPISLTFVLIAALIFAFSGALFNGLYTKAQLECYSRNADLATEGKYGPYAPCP